MSAARGAREKTDGTGMVGERDVGEPCSPTVPVPAANLQPGSGNGSCAAARERGTPRAPRVPQAAAAHGADVAARGARERTAATPAWVTGVMGHECLNSRERRTGGLEALVETPRVSTGTRCVPGSQRCSGPLMEIQTVHPHLHLSARGW